MTELIPLMVAFLVGCVLGAASAYGLWWTLRRLPRRSRPVLFLAASYLLRTAVVVVGLVVVMDGQWERIAVALLGYLAGRAVLIRIYGVGAPQRAAT